MDDTKINFGKEASAVFPSRIRELIKESGISQKDLAEDIGVTRQSLSLYINGQRTPDIEVLKRICGHFSISADWLLGLSEVKDFDIDVKAISENTGLSGDAIETLSGLEELKTIKGKIAKKDMQILATDLKLKSINSDLVDKIMDSSNEDGLYFKLMFNKLIEADEFTRLFTDFAQYALDQTLLKDFEKWANDYLDENLNEELIDSQEIYGFGLSKGNKEHKETLKKSLYQSISNSLMGEFYQIGLKSVDPEFLRFAFYGKFQNMIDSIAESVENEAQNTKTNQLRFLRMAEIFKDIFEQYKIDLLRDSHGSKSFWLPEI